MNARNKHKKYGSTKEEIQLINPLLNKRDGIILCIIFMNITLKNKHFRIIEILDFRFVYD